METVVKPLEWLVPYTDPIDPYMVRVALDTETLLRFHHEKVYLLKTDLAYRNRISPMRDLSWLDIMNYWKSDVKEVDAYIQRYLDYESHRDSSLNKTNRGYLSHGDDSDEIQNILLRMFKVSVNLE